jgi:hypothetical protein
MAPLQVQLAVAAAVVLVSAGSGAAVNGWRLKASHSQEVATLTGRVVALEAEIALQNAATQLLKQAGDAAAAARKRAEREADAQRQAAKSRDEWISKLQGACPDVLRDAWGRL